MNPRRLVPLVLAFLVLAGCTRDVGAQKAPKKAAPRETDETGAAVDDLRAASNVSGCRDVLRRLNPTLDKQSDLQLSAEQRAWLEKVGLGPEELVEIDARTYRPLDAYHLEGAILFRDAARMLEIAGLEPLEQAKYVFDWVDRRVLLHQRCQDGMPAAYVLRAGFGGPGDRAAVSLAVLHQLRIPGCVLAVPGATEPSLIAVAVEKDAYLFDPRTGRPLPTADRKEVATWQQLRAHPELGKFVDLAPDQITKLDARLMAPLESLSPRMEYLERLLKGEDSNVGSDRIALFVDGAETSRALGEAGLPPPGLWNPNPDLGPLYALRRFLPPEEGGRDKTNRLARFTADLVPSGPVLAQYRKLRLIGEQSAVERAKVEQLLKITDTLFGLYYRQPQEMLVRGKTEKLPRQLDRILTILDETEAAEANDDPPLAQSAAAWRKRADEAYLAAIRNDPTAGEKVARLWNEDSLDFLLHLDRESSGKDKEPQILTRLILSAIRETMGEQASFLLAGLSHDKAERAEALARNQRRLRKETKGLDKNAAEAWKKASSGWTRYIDRSNLGPKSLPGQLEAFRRLRGSPEMALATLEHLQLEMHRYASARLQLARCRSHSGGDGGPDLDIVLAELEPIARTDGPLAREIEAFRDQLAPLPPPLRDPLRQRLDLLRRDFGDDGNLTWTLREVRDVRGK